SHGIAAQTLLEHRTLEYVKQALRTAIEWNADSVGAERKLSSVRFIAESLERHLRRMMDLEETGGYMGAAVDEKPHLAEQIEKLRADHERIRQELPGLLARLTVGDPRNIAELPASCAALAEFVDRL